MSYFVPIKTRVKAEAVLFSSDASVVSPDGWYFLQFCQLCQVWCVADITYMFSEWAWKADISQIDHRRHYLDFLKTVALSALCSLELWRYTSLTTQPLSLYVCLPSHSLTLTFSSIYSSSNYRLSWSFCMCLNHKSNSSISKSSYMQKWGKDSIAFISLLASKLGHGHKVRLLTVIT